MQSQHEVFRNIFEDIKKRLVSSFAEAEVDMKVELRKNHKELKNVPICYVEMTDLSPTANIGTGEIELVSRWEISVVASNQNHFTIMDASAFIAAILHNEYIADLYPCRYVGSSDGQLSFNIPNYTCWHTELEITVRAGVDDWKRFDFFPENRLGD